MAEQQETTAGASKERKPSTLALAYQYRGVLPAAIHASVSHFVLGPRSPSWSWPLSLFTALAQSSHPVQAQKRQQQIERIQQNAAAHQEGSDPSVIRAVQAQRKRYQLDKLLPPPTRLGTWFDASVPVRKRALSGVLQSEADKETGERVVKGEWSVHNDLVDETGVKAGERVLLYLHGGAYMVMSPASHRHVVMRFSRLLNARALSLDYRLAPESPFPLALMDVVSTILYLVEELHVEPSNIVIAGDSAGGGLSMATMLYLAEHGMPQVGGAILLSPYVDGTSSLRSWEENSAYDYLPCSPLVTPESPASPFDPMSLYLTPQRYWDLVQHPYVSPSFCAPLELLAKLPPTLVNCGALEVLRDECVLLAARMRLAKKTHQKPLSDVCAEVWDGGIHVGVAFDVWQGSHEAFDAFEGWSVDHLPDLVSSASWHSVDETFSATWREARARYVDKLQKMAESSWLPRLTPSLRAPSPSPLFEAQQVSVGTLEARKGAPTAMKEALEQVQDDGDEWVTFWRYKEQSWLAWLFGAKL